MSCLMDRHGNASFWLRGINMGVAFQGEFICSIVIFLFVKEI